MMPFDPTAAIVFGSMLAALVLSLLYAVWYQSLKHKTKRGNSDLSKSVGLSELESLMRRTLKEALAPLEDRMDVLDERIRSVQHALGARPDVPGSKALPAPQEELPIEQSLPESDRAERTR